MTEVQSSVCTEEGMERVMRSILKKAEYDRKHYQERSEDMLEQQHQYYQGHQPERVEYQRRYSQEHSTEIAEYHRQYRQEHGEGLAEYLRRYYQEHPSLRGRYNRDRRVLEAGAGGDFTTEEFVHLCEVYGNRCAYCREELPLGPDHAAPLSRGGNNNIENIVPACRSCNNRKGTRTYDEYVKSLIEQGGVEPW